MSYRDKVAVLTITHTAMGKFVLRDDALEIAARADAEIESWRLRAEQAEGKVRAVERTLQRLIEQ